ncbi:leucyl aminopeptidase [soil metagenome]
MRAEASKSPFSEIEADLGVIALSDGEELPAQFADLPGADDVRTAYRELTLLRSKDSTRLLVIGLGKPDDVDAERLRVAAALAAKQAGRLEATSLAWALPSSGPAAGEGAAALAEGTILAAYAFNRFITPDPKKPRLRIEKLTVAVGDAAEDEVAEALRVAKIATDAQNRARDLQNLPPNVATPNYLAERAREIADAHGHLSVKILGHNEIVEHGIGGLHAVAQGSEIEPRLITMTYTGGGSGEKLGLIGKAVTFDSGGISIKPSAGMQDMKMDMSGGAAVIEAVGAIADLGLKLNIVAVVPATENMPSGAAFRPGDVIQQFNGKTIEITNTDAEGRLILADALSWAIQEMGADRLVDLATLTGAVVVALGSTYAGLISNDDEFSEEVRSIGERTGEILWRLPLHEEYRRLIDSKIADLMNTAPKRKAGTIYAGSYLNEFVEDKPWAHLDIAGTSWDTGREYWGSGPTGFGVRLLVELARARASAQSAT